MIDREVRTTASRDNQHHYDLGDTVEWFLKPPGGTHYWECYATPNGYRTAMFWPRADRTEIDPFIACDHLSHIVAPTPGAVAAPGWVADLLIPASLLESQGDAWGPSTTWTTLAARYNHGLPESPTRPPQEKTGNDPTIELTSFPPLSAVNFHSISEYIPLRCVR